ncbi:MAG: mitochondrial fission ELM1 family protein [Rhodospirillales bacterium]
MDASPRIWLLIDDRAGNESQCRGVAEALGLPFEERRLAYSWGACLPNALLGASFAGLAPDCKARLTPPWPDLVIAAGRRTAPVARAIKHRSGGAAKLVQIMDPGPAGAGDFDLIAIPGHDRAAEHPDRPANVMTITGAPHRMTPERLDAAARHWRAAFEHLPKPWIALIVGGGTRRRSFSAAMAAELGAMASAMARSAGGSLLITTSRRTGPAGARVLAAVDAPRYAFTWGEEGENPYAGYLALADAVVVTGDSVSMCSEACAMGKPVYVFAPPPLITGKHARFHRSLYQGGYARPFTGVYEGWSHPPLNAARDIAAAIRAKLKL